MYKIYKHEKHLSVDKFKENYLDIDKFLKLCEKCPHYENNWSCPPFNFNPMDLWNRYDNIKIIAFKINFNQDLLDKTFTEDEINNIIRLTKKEKRLLMKTLLMEETQYVEALALFPGACDLCEFCTKINGEECIKPFLMRHSPESLGASMDEIIEKELEIDVLWPKNGKLPEHLVYIGAVIYN